MDAEERSESEGRGSWQGRRRRSAETCARAQAFVSGSDRCRAQQQAVSQVCAAWLLITALSVQRTSSATTVDSALESKSSTYTTQIPTLSGTRVSCVYAGICRHRGAPTVALLQQIERSDQATGCRRYYVGGRAGLSTPSASQCACRRRKIARGKCR